MSSILINNITSLYTCDGDDDIGYKSNAAIVINNGNIIYIGNAIIDDIDNYDIIINGNGLIAIPGVVDCHTHSVWAGSRSKEFSNRLNGMSYIDILQQGGGILSTVNDTRKATIDELSKTCQYRLNNMLITSGITTCEVKSGYGLNTITEKNMLIAAKQAAAASEGEGGGGGIRAVPRVTTTYLGAHTIPNEYKDNRYGYIRDIIENQLPVCAPLSDSIDIFCDKGAFTLQEADTILSYGKDTYGLKVKAHAEQIEHSGCAELVGKLNGISADHLERLDINGINAMKDANVVAVMLPGAQLYLKDKSPPTTLLRDNGVHMAIGSDLNPGSSPIHNIFTCATLSCILQGLTIKEALLGITRYAGQAIGMPKAGWLGINNHSYADIVLIQPPIGDECNIESVIQHINGHIIRLVIKDGNIVYNNTC